MPDKEKESKSNGKKSTSRAASSNNKQVVGMINMLKQDHKETMEIIEKLIGSRKGSRAREDGFMQLETELSGHMRIEEDLLYPLLLEKKDTRELAMEGYEEHHVAKFVLQELGQMPKDDEGWPVKLKVFKEVLEHHIKEEEKEIFKKMRDSVKDQEVEGMMDRAEQIKQEVKQGMANTEPVGA